ncbi:hypothetical protein EON67_06055, partial [archaeon]
MCVCVCVCVYQSSMLGCAPLPLFAELPPSWCLPACASRHASVRATMCLCGVRARAGACCSRAPTLMVVCCLDTLQRVPLPRIGAGCGPAGQLGIDTTTLRSTRPYPIPALRTKRVLALACGGSHAFAIVTEASGSGAMTLGPLPRGEATHNGAAGGVLMAWGASFVGALGFADAVQSYTPRVVNFPDAPPGALVTYVAAGLVSSAAVVNGKKLYVWGDASYGRLGLGDVGYAATPVPIREPTPLELTHPDGTSLVPVQVGCGGSFSAFLARPPMQPPGSGCYLLTSGVIGADLYISEASPGKPDARSDGADAGGAVSVSVRDPVLADNPDSKPAPVQLVPTLCTALGSEPTCVQVAAAATHYAVIARCARPTSVAANTMLTVAARALSSKAASGAAVVPPPSEPTKVRGSLYTAGFGFLG